MKRNVFFQCMFTSYGLTDSYGFYRTEVNASCEIVIQITCFTKLPGKHF